MARRKVKLSNWRKLECNIDYADVIHEYGEKCVNILKNTSPVKTGDYAKTWTIDEKKDVYQRYYYCTIWNDKNYRLTHLLENGHIIANKRGGVGWASAHKHIGKAYRQIRNPLIRAVEKAKVNIIIE